MDIKTMNSPEFWDDKIYNGYSAISQSPIYKNKLNIVLNEIKKCHGNILDVGIGYGFIEELICKYKLNIKIYGVDISKFSIQNARNRYRGKFVVGNILKIPFKNNLLDCVLALDILEHLSHPQCLKGLHEIRRVMKYGAKLVISVPINESRTDIKNNHHLQKYNFVKMNKQLNAVGFKLLDKYYLTAYKNLYFFKNILNRIISISNPNLLIVVCKKI